MSKAFVCRCEDLTLAEVDHAIEQGATCFEDLKRTIGVGTGPCQGKSCVMVCNRVLHARGFDVERMDVMTFRPPIRGVELGSLAGEDPQPHSEEE